MEKAKSTSRQGILDRKATVLGPHKNHLWLQSLLMHEVVFHLFLGVLGFMGLISPRLSVFNITLDMHIQRLGVCGFVYHAFWVTRCVVVFSGLLSSKMYQICCGLWFLGLEESSFCEFPVPGHQSKSRST